MVSPILIPTYDLPALLKYLSNAAARPQKTWQGWQLSMVDGGSNNRLFRATSAEADLAVKFILPDNRRRAEREFTALCLLADLPRPAAPAPVWLGVQGYPFPVVVQCWVEGPCSREPLETDEAWLRLLQLHALIHTVRPENSDPLLAGEIFKAVTTAYSPAQALALVQAQVGRLPLHERNADLLRLVRGLEDSLAAKSGADAAWQNVPEALCHGDGNLSNFVRRPEGWLAIDWENSGWGDPAFEIADLLAHPAMFEVPPERRAWAMRTYARLSAESSAEEKALLVRIRIYYRVMLVWWVARMARCLVEAPLGQDERLAPRPEGWQDEMRAQYARYLKAAS